LNAIYQSTIQSECFNIGGKNELENLELAQKICKILDRVLPRQGGQSYLDQIHFVKDRAGHDFRYAIDGSKIFQQLGWKPSSNFKSCLETTVKWYVNTSQAGFEPSLRDRMN
jgi:dTDP-glucose 4,6-dehydratase